MNDEYTKTVVLNDDKRLVNNTNTPSHAKDANNAADHNNDQPSGDDNFTQTYSYLT